MKNWMNKTTVLISAFALFISFAACTSKSKKEEYGLDMKETIRINLRSEPPSIDWSKATDTTSSEVISNIMDSLVLYDIYDADLKLIPGLAEKWEPNKSADQWTLTLRKGVKWTDGVEFTAQHVADGWERLLNPKTASEYAYALFVIKGAQDYNGGKQNDFSKVGVVVKDANTVVVNLARPVSFFPYLLTHHSTLPIRKDVVEKHGDKWTDPKNIVTLGPFTLKVWDHDKALVMERNESYYGEKAKVKNILAYMINEETTAINLFEAGKIDFLHDIPSKELPRLRKMGEYREVGTLLLQYWGFNTTKKPFDDPKVRQAVNMAVDRKEIVTMLAGGQIPVTSWIPAGMFGYEPGKGLEFSPEKAKAMLVEAGFGEGKKKFPKIELVFNTNEDHKRVAENIQAQLKRNLGIEIEIQNEEWKVFLSRLKTDPPAIFRMGWLADYPDPDNFMNLMTSYSENNRTKWKNTDYDKLIEKAVAELDVEKRKALYSQAQALLVEKETPVIPLFNSVRQLLISKRLENPPVNRLEVYRHNKVSIRQ
ncbi:MAG: peptide ABC transporter substrate-binding protein [Bdellovibrionia bacterium]